MARTLRLAFAALVLVAATPALADPISMTKSATVVSDSYSVAPKSLPGASVDYKLIATNGLVVARNVVLTDVIAGTVKLRVLDIAGAGKGPVEFQDGNLLGLGLLGSGLAITKVEYSDGTSWSYAPVADADGCDANVRGIRVTLATTFSSLGSFQLRYRVLIR